jgi:hypothetical protein
LQSLKHFANFFERRDAAAAVRCSKLLYASVSCCTLSVSCSTLLYATIRYSILLYATLRYTLYGTNFVWTHCIACPNSCLIFLSPKWQFTDFFLLSKSEFARSKPFFLTKTIPSQDNLCSGGRRGSGFPGLLFS